jgi:hypothetical protein
MSLIAAVYSAVLALNKRTWVSGMIVKEGQVVRSPLDKEDYQRITATGGGTTDPSLDMTNYIGWSYRRTTALYHLQVAAGSSANITNRLAGALKVPLGTITVGTRVTALSITGRGAIDFLGAFKGATGTWRIEVIVDSREIFNEVIDESGAPFDILIGTSSKNPTNDSDKAERATAGVEFKRSFEVFVTPVATNSGTNGGIAYIPRGVE